MEQCNKKTELEANEKHDSIIKKASEYIKKCKLAYSDTRKKMSEEAEERQLKLKDTTPFKLTKSISKYWDRYYLDPIIGLLAPGVGDALSSLFAIPALWMSVVKLKSIPLTLAIIYNVLVDAVIGIFPFLIADIIDAANKANTKNLQLIIGFIENDKTIIREVKRKATITAVLIVILCILLAIAINFATWIVAYISQIINGML